MLHRLKSNKRTEQELADEIGLLLSDLKKVAADDILQVYLFGSASSGASAMHQYSDIDLCVIVRDEVDLKIFRRKVPVSQRIPVDWIIVHEAEFSEKSGTNSGVFSVIAREGRLLWGWGVTAG
jgi:predicted nucleotidyltransferase